MEGDRVKLKEFKQIIQSEFGKNLEHATPANVREFLDRFQQKMHREKTGERQRIDIHESAASYEEVIRDFFARVLDHPSDEAIINLWMLAFELSFAAEEDLYSEKFTKLFHDIEA